MTAASPKPAADPRLAGLAELVTPELRGNAPYHVPAPVGIRAKLDANELPFPLPPDLAAGLAAALADVNLERYPLADGGELRAAAAATLGVPPEQVVFGNGSDELIAMLCAAFAAPRPGHARAAILYPWPTFVYYRIATTVRGLDAVEVPLEDDFTLDHGRLEAALAARRPNIAFFALPNNPTGSLWSPEWVADLAARNPDVIVVSDEAYIAYGGRTLLPRLAELPNLVVMRTLSKIGMAGLRIGYLTAHPLIIAELEKVRPPYNLGTLPVKAATWLLTHAGDWIADRAREVAAERPRLAAALAALPGIRVFDSEANLVMIRVGTAGDGRATAVWKALRERGILVRTFDRPGNSSDPLSGCLRITVGTPAENRLLVDELRAILA
jgi:histidinol-phosphate aminotransferase